MKNKEKQFSLDSTNPNYGVIAGLVPGNGFLWIKRCGNPGQVYCTTSRIKSLIRFLQSAIKTPKPKKGVTARKQKGKR